MSEISVSHACHSLVIDKNHRKIPRDVIGIMNCRRQPLARIEGQQLNPLE